MSATVFLRGPRLRPDRRRHPWVFRQDILRTDGKPSDGDAVRVCGPEGEFLAHGLFNGRSRMLVRLVSFEEDRPVDDALLRERVAGAVRLRQEALRLPERADAYRVINAEGDGLPGLIVDRYGDALVYTCSSLGTARRLDPILDALQESLAPAAIVEAPLRKALRRGEGLDPARGLVRGELAAEQTQVTIDGLKLEVRLIGGQKTGLFLDQRDSVQRVAGLAAGKRVLDACCYVGAFGLACAQSGASEALLFDSSQGAVDSAQRNAEANGLSERVEVRKGTLYRELKGLADAKRVFDIIILDPPKFAPTRASLDKAHKGYLDANAGALELLAPGGLLLTCSCSHHMDAERFNRMLREAATRAGVQLRVLETRGPGPDHPTDVACPEGRYLKAVLAQRV